ncbi:MAG: DUF6335 family protein [Thermoanaerobaculia bacterium]
MDKTEKLIDWKENERPDKNRNGIDDRIEPPIPDVSPGSAKLANQLKNDPLADPLVTSGDLEDDESAVSSSSTPDQNVVEEIAGAMGITYADDEELKVGEKERSRDKHRWELDPASSDDYKDRLKGQK